MDKLDRFGNPIDLTTYGGYQYGLQRKLSIIYRPCIPTEKTPFTTNCLVNDSKNKTEIVAQLNKSKKYVGEAKFTVILNK